MVARECRSGGWRLFLATKLIVRSFQIVDFHAACVVFHLVARTRDIEEKKKIMCVKM